MSGPRGGSVAPLAAMVAVLVAAVAAALGAFVALASPAHAGGSAWTAEKVSYVPGEVAVARGDFGAGCCERGWVDDGPYRVWLVPYGEHDLTDLVLSPDAIPVGELRTQQVHHEWAGHPTSDWVASVEFVVPDVPAGPYQLVHCTDPCGKGLGDLMYAFFWVGRPPDFRPPEASPARVGSKTRSTRWVAAVTRGVGAVTGAIAVTTTRLRTS